MTADGIGVIFSDRKSLSLEIRPDGTPLIRAPRGTDGKTIEAFLGKHEKWLKKHTASVLERAKKYAAIPPFTAPERSETAAKAAVIIPERVAFFAPRVGVTYAKIAIRFQKSKWGSCSSKGNLSFNALLALAPPYVLDAVVVHELCHIQHMDHSAAFYKEVCRVYPDHDAAKAWLKNYGGALLARLGG